MDGHNTKQQLRGELCSLAAVGVGRVFDSIERRARARGMGKPGPALRRILGPVLVAGLEAAAGEIRRRLVDGPAGGDRSAPARRRRSVRRRRAGA